MKVEIVVKIVYRKKAKKILKEKYGENYTLNMNNAFKKKYGVENPM